jgi:CRISPR/Cas system Type II protein with McrA/HNH and RuvC-like nuclease domain
VSLVLGLDIGANSLGWSLYDSDILNYIDSGVRIFSDIDSSGAESNANANVERGNIVSVANPYTKSL